MGCVLKNHCNDDAFVKPFYTKARLQPNEIREVVMNVYLPSNFKSEKVVLLFQFENSEGERFGDPMIGIIDVDLPLEDEIDNDDIFCRNPKKERKNSIKQSQMINDEVLY